MSISNILFLDELFDFLNEKKVKLSDVCLIGSAVLAYYGLRKNHDLEIALRPSALKSIQGRPSGSRWVLPITNNLDLFRNQLLYVGISDRRLFAQHLYTTDNGINLVLIEAEYLYKNNLNREKDEVDAIRIKELFPSIDSSAAKYYSRAGRFYRKMNYYLNKLN